MYKAINIQINKIYVVITINTTAFINIRCLKLFYCALRLSQLSVNGTHNNLHINHHETELTAHYSDITTDYNIWGNLQSADSWMSDDTFFPRYVQMNIISVLELSYVDD